MALIPLLGYSPDIDPTTPGAMPSVTSMVPTLRGMKAAPSAADADITVLSDPCLGAAVLTELDDSTHLYAGTLDALYEAASGLWSDVSRSGGYTLDAGARWRFAQFGNISLATQKADVLQSAAGASFSDVTSAPSGSIVEVVGQFVFLFDTSDGSFGDSPDRWWCSALGVHNNWTPSQATQSATGTLTSSAGRITAGRKFGDGIIAYKKKSMYVGIYVGPPIIWAWQQLPGDVGALCQEVVINIGTQADPRHVFMSEDNFYLFDGARPVPLDSPLRETVFGEIDLDNAGNLAYGQHDKTNALVRFFYPSGVSTSIADKCVVWNYKSNKWGRDDQEIEAAMEFIAPGTTYSGLGSLFTTYGDLPVLPYGKAFQAGGIPLPAIFGTDHRIATLTGPSAASGFSTGDYGDDNQLTQVSRVKPRFLVSPSSGQLIHKYRMNLSDTPSQDQAIVMSDKRFDVLRSARWHRDDLSFVGDVELSAIDIQGQPDGEE